MCVCVIMCVYAYVHLPTYIFAPLTGLTASFLAARLSGISRRLLLLQQLRAAAQRPLPPGDHLRPRHGAAAAPRGRVPVGGWQFFYDVNLCMSELKSTLDGIIVDGFPNGDTSPSAPPQPECADFPAEMQEECNQDILGCKDTICKDTVSTNAYPPHPD
jgi:hypothetical protein